jgi:hypothetical protein
MWPGFNRLNLRPIAHAPAPQEARMVSPQGDPALLAHPVAPELRPIMPRMARIFVRPEWVGVQDFQTRFPNALERAGAHSDE